MSRLKKLAAVVAATVAIGLAQAPAAQAGHAPLVASQTLRGDGCVAGVLCGRVTSSAGNPSSKRVQISNHWRYYAGSPGPYVLPQDKYTLAPGQRSTSVPGWEDVDAYWFPAPCKFKHYFGTRGASEILTGNIWRKIPDSFDTLIVTLSGC